MVAAAAHGAAPAHDAGPRVARSRGFAVIASHRGRGLAALTGELLK
jgi:outer membrane protein W